MLCPLCHTPNRDNAKFCKGCGRLLTNESEQMEEPVATEQAQEVSQPVQEPVQVPDTHNAAAQATENQAQVPGPADNTIDDISLAPTQILSPQQMLAYHTRRWQEELSHEEQQSQGYDITNQPTVLFTTASVPDPHEQVVPDYDAADQPTILAPPQDAGTQEAAQLPADAEEEATETPVNVSGPADQENDSPDRQEVTPAATAESATTSAEDISIAVEGDHVEQVTGSTTPDQTTTSFPVLATGTIIGERYEITQAISDTGEEHVYAVTDHKGYLHCWNCGSEENGEGDAFCNDCGAELLDATYVMHEYSPATASTQDEHVLHGVIINTLVEHGLTYVIEQPQATQSEFPNGVHVIASCSSDAGMLRRADPNEDSTFVLLFERVHELVASPAGVFIVADGMGGHANGQGASRMTVNTIAERIVRELLMPPLSAEKTGEAVKALER